MTKPTITIPHTVTFGEPGLRFHAFRALDFMKMMDFLYPRFIGGSADRGGVAYLAFDDHGLIGSLTGRPNGGGFSAGSTLKNPFYRGDRNAVLKMMLALTAKGGSTTLPSETALTNYGMLTLWSRMGLGVRALGANRWKSQGATPETLALMTQARVAAKVPFGAELDLARSRLASIKDAERFIPKEDDLGAPAFVCYVDLLSQEQAGDR